MYKHAKKTLLNSTVGVTKSRFIETSGCEEFHSFEILEGGGEVEEIWLQVMKYQSCGWKVLYVF